MYGVLAGTKSNVAYRTDFFWVGQNDTTAATMYEACIPKTPWREAFAAFLFIFIDYAIMDIVCANSSSFSLYLTR
jgi:hypothetical protein